MILQCYLNEEAATGLLTDLPEVALTYTYRIYFRLFYSINIDLNGLVN